MAGKSSPEIVKHWRIARFNAELLHAKYITQSFPRHTHDQYAIGVIETGALGFYYRGENLVAPPGRINLCIPGEVHTGQAATFGGWEYRMFYFDPLFLQEIAGDIGRRPHDIPFFKSGVIDDDELARLIRRLHHNLEQGDTPVIEQESNLLWTLGQMILRHADDPPPLQTGKKEPWAVEQSKQFIETHYPENFSLNDLAHLTHLSPFHLIHVFRQSTGIPPHAYLRQVRVRRAKELLACGHPIVNVAQATGFNDQSHLNRWFKRLLGLTPGQYRNSVQYN